MIYVLATGQSNMGGRFPYPLNFSTATRVKVRNNSNPLGSNGTSWITPVEGAAPFNASGATNLAVWFCKRLSIEMNDDVRLAIVFRDSSDLSYWDPSTGLVYQEIEDVWGDAGAPAADILLWHQGENGGTSYKANWIIMRNALRTAGILKADAPAILGGLQGTRIGGTNDTYLQELAAENDDVYYADSSGLTSLDAVPLHFDGVSLYEFGYNRYWAQYRAHIGEPPRVQGNILAGIIKGF
jgi:hypothetical protein